MSGSEFPAIDERLSRAENSSNLDSEALSRVDLDFLIAAGWAAQDSRYVLGRYLIALESEWDSSEQPRSPREHDIEALAKRLPAMVEIQRPNVNGQMIAMTVSARQAAQIEVERWYEAERMRLVGRLRALAPTSAALALWAEIEGMKKPRAMALGILAWWLDHRCPKCFGSRLDPLPFGGRGSTRVCKSCQGLGERPLPYGQEGRKLERHLIECRNHAEKIVKSGATAARRMRQRYAQLRNTR